MRSGVTVKVIGALFRLGFSRALNSEVNRHHQSAQDDGLVESKDRKALIGLTISCTIALQGRDSDRGSRTRGVVAHCEHLLNTQVSGRVLDCISQSRAILLLTRLLRG